MKSIRRTRAILAVLVGMSSALTLTAQEKVAIEIDKPALVELNSPQMGGGNSKSFNPKEWIEFEVKFEVSHILPKDAKFVDDLVVKWYVGVVDENNKALLLEKTVEHVSVPVKEEVYSSVYLSPAAVLRLTGDERVNPNSVKYFGGEVVFNGQVIKTFVNKGDVKKPFWKGTGLSVYNKVALRAKNETPFAVLWWDRYAENKVKP